jgi:flavin-binding protein dodecin
VTDPTAEPASEESVRIDKVVRLIGTSTRSWEDATRLAVAEAAKSVRELDRAAVVELDTVVRDGAVVLYRAKVEVSFRVDRARTTDAGEVVEVRRYLVVGNETLSGPRLTQAILERIGAGPSEFHVLVPCTPSRIPGHASLALGDPLTGYIDPNAITTAQLDDDAHDRASARLRDFIDQITDLGGQVTGEVGGADPLRAVQQVLYRSTFDEIILSTLPAGISRWLRMDLAARLRRTTDVPVTHLEATGYE